MLSNGVSSFTYDSANRLITADGHTYTYNAENVRIRNLCENEDTTYTYNTNCRLSTLLCKTTNGVITKYVYGRGLIGEETNSSFKTYHFDFRGSTIAITDEAGNITDTFAYDTYGKLIERTSETDTVFLYDGRDGVVTDTNGLLYMRARYYSPEMKRFVNADIVAGQISNAVTLNRFAYANGNPVSNIDPFGLSSEGKTDGDTKEYVGSQQNVLYEFVQNILGLDITAEDEKTIPIFNIPGVSVNMNVSISYTLETNPNANIITNVDPATGDVTLEVKTPELALPNDAAGLQVAGEFDPQEMSLGTSLSVRLGNWTFEFGQEINLASESRTIAVSYEPDDPLLPSIKIELEVEVTHLAKLVAAAAIVAISAIVPIVTAAATPAAVTGVAFTGAATVGTASASAAGSETAAKILPMIGEFVLKNAA